jgi:hypothetical protein
MAVAFAIGKKNSPAPAGSPATNFSSFTLNTSPSQIGNLAATRRFSWSKLTGIFVLSAVSN